MARLLTLVALVVALASTPSVAMAQSSQDTIIYYHTDAIGSVRAITDANGGLLARYDFEPFGVQCGSARGTGTPPETIQFAGKERDTDTTLDYLGARYYEAVSGRFIAVDPVLDIDAALTDPQRWNRHAYAANNPFRYIDPDGRVVIPVIVYAAVAVAASPAGRRWGLDHVRSRGRRPGEVRHRTD
jgi:RHS repeat-associated protein